MQMYAHCPECSPVLLCVAPQALVECGLAQSLLGATETSWLQLGGFGLWTFERDGKQNS